MEERYKVSVIIPIYNVQEYLDECINSIVKQTYQNLEIILVDDGSDDGSSSICDEFARMDQRIKTMTVETFGVEYPEPDKM